MGKSSIENQLEKYFKHTRQGSFGTRSRYESSCRKFAEFVSKNFKLQNLRNISDKHLAAFSKSRIEQEIEPKTLKNDLGAIRYLHDQISRPRYQLADNQELQKKFNFELEQTPQVKGDRAWTSKEYEGMKKLAIEKGRTIEADTMTLSRTMGLRVSEAVAIRRSQAEYALRTGIHQVLGEAKNGKPREVPLSPEARKIFERRLPETPRGERLFISSDEKLHHVRGRAEKWLERNREQVTTENGRELRTYEDKVEPMTYHGLRYSYIQDRMNQEMENGFSKSEAAALISKEVGHERVEVINIYIAGR